MNTTSLHNGDVNSAGSTFLGCCVWVTIWLQVSSSRWIFFADVHPPLLLIALSRKLVRAGLIGVLLPGAVRYWEARTVKSKHESFGGWESRALVVTKEQHS